MFQRVPVHIGALVLLLTALACSDAINPAVGPNAHVTIFTDLDRSDTPVELIQASFEREVLTTRPERAFEIELAREYQFKGYRQFKNLVFLATLDQETDLTKRIRKLTGDRVYGELKSGTRPFAIYSDVWAAGQTVMVIAASGRAALDDLTTTYADALYDSLEMRVRMGLLKSLYVRGEQSEFSGYVRRNYGWTIRAPKDYTVEEDRDSSMVFLHMETPERWLFVHWEPMSPDEFTAENCLARRTSLAHHFYQGDFILDGTSLVEKTRFDGYPAYRISGHWQNERYEGHPYGGPFRMIALHDGRRLYVIDTVVYLPTMNKWPYLRQLEAIAHTFHLEPEGS